MWGKFFDFIAGNWPSVRLVIALYRKQYGKYLRFSLILRLFGQVDFLSEVTVKYEQQIKYLSKLHEATMR